MLAETVRLLRSGVLISHFAFEERLTSGGDAVVAGRVVKKSALNPEGGIAVAGPASTLHLHQLLQGASYSRSSLP